MDVNMRRGFEVGRNRSIIQYSQSMTCQYDLSFYNFFPTELLLLLTFYFPV